jgi:hypothetical protein
VYLGTSPTLGSAELKSTQSGTSYTSSALNYSTTYFWRVDEVNAQGTTPGPVWTFTTAAGRPGQATAPNPPHNATAVTRNPTLTWTAGASATSHSVYLSTSSNLKNGDRVSTQQPGTSYTPNTLQANKAYFWRVDEINADGTTTGATWKFTTGTSTAAATIEQTALAPQGESSQSAASPVELGPVRDQGVIQGESLTVPLTLVAGASDALQWAVASADSDLIPVGTLVLEPAAPGPRLTLTPAVNLSGVTTITVSAYDDSTISRCSFRVSVLPVSALQTSFGFISLPADAASLTAPLALGTDSGATFLSSPTAGGGSAAWPLTLTAPGRYWLWAFMLANSTDRDSFQISIDDGFADLFQAGPTQLSGAWQWLPLTTPTDPTVRVPYYLLDGLHTLTLRATDPDTPIQALLLTNDPDFRP